MATEEAIFFLELVRPTGLHPVQKYTRPNSESSLEVGKICELDPVSVLHFACYHSSIQPP